MPELTRFQAVPHNLSAMPETRQKPVKGTLPEMLPVTYRSIEVRAVRTGEGDQQQKTYPIVLASEEPVRRSGWFGWYYEVLPMDTLNQQRLKNGLAVLVNHDPNQRAGVLGKDYSIDGTKLRGNVRFGPTPFAQGIRSEVDDETLQGCSVGYVVDEYQRSADINPEDDEDEDYLGTFRASSWEVYEVSLTPIEADVAAGVGRNADQNALHPVRLRALNPPANGTERTHPMQEPAIVVGEDQMKQERARTAGIADLQRRYPEQLTQEQTSRFIAEGSTVAEVKSYVLDQSVEQRSKINASQSPLLNERETKQYSFMRAIGSQIPGEHIDAGFEREVSQTVAKRLGRAAEGIMIPTGEKIFALTDEERERRSLQQRSGLVSSTYSAGGATVATELVGFIDLLRPALRLRDLGATFMPGCTSNFAMPKMLSDVGFNWGGENPGVDNVDVDPSFGQVAFSPKQAIASTSVSRRLVIQSSIDIEAMVREALVKQAAIGIEKAALTGPTGSTTTPQGLLNTAGVNLLAIGANGGVPGYNVWTALMNDIAVQNAELGAMAYLTTPEIRDTAMNQAELANTISKPIWSIGPDGVGRVAGQPAAVSNLVPKNLTKGTGTGLHAIIYGYWPALRIAEFGAMDVIVNPYLRMRQAMIDIAATFLIDCNVTYPVAFSVVLDAQTNTLAL